MEDEDNKRSRFDILGFVPQNENIYNKLLPYADQLDAESNRLFKDIKTNLVKSVVAREIRPGFLIWSSRLITYIKIYGLKFSKDDHIALAKLYYELLIIPNLEPARINKFATTLNFLLKKKLLSPDDLKLNWRPLYELYVNVTEKSKNEVGMYKQFSSLDPVIENLVRICRYYFPISATQELLDELRPKLCPYSSTFDVCRTIEHLELFLPIFIPYEQRHLGYELWLKELLDLWGVCHNANHWENHLAWLMARLSCNNSGHIDWRPYIPIMFVRFARALHLPVSYKKRQSGKQYKIDGSAVAVWIVCCIGGDSTEIFFHLEKFMQTLETYYHPANLGKWTPRIRELLKKLSYYFVQRVYFERYRKPDWQSRTPDNFKITDSDIERFINILKPCLKQAMFSRLGSQDIAFAFQYLSALRPDLIVPIVLDKLYTAMDSLTEPHKFTSALICMMSVARFMAHGAKNNYVEGPTHLFPMLTSLLPGIDPNDFRKCLMTLNLIAHFANLAPFVNSSEASNYYNDLTEEEHTICEASASLEDFVLQFFDRIFIWIESSAVDFVRLEQSGNDHKSRLETISEGALLSVITSMLYQCSPEIYMSALKKLHNYATTNIFEPKVSGKLVAILASAFAKVNAEETFKIFLPELCDTIDRLLGDDDEILKEVNLGDELFYNLQLLAEILDGHTELIYYVDKLILVLDRVLLMTSPHGSRMATHMLNMMMGSLSFTQLLDYRSCSEPYTKHVKDFFTVREWAKPGDVHNLNLTWYVPGSREVACIQKLLNRYLVPEVVMLNKYASGEVVLDRKELRRRIRIVSASLGCQSVLPHWQEAPIQLLDSALDPWMFDITLGTTHTVNMPDGSNIRKVIADTIHNVQRKVLEIDEGDTKSIHNIIFIYEGLIFNKFRGRDFETHWKRFHVVKKVLEDRLHQNKSHLRYTLIDRVMLQHEFRNECRTSCFTATHQQVLFDLFELSVCHYSEIRISAQSKLFAILAAFPYSYKTLLPKLLEILHMDSTEHHEKFKGCLYILLGTKNAPMVTRHDWGWIRELWPVIIKSKPSEKPSIINLMNAIENTVHYFLKITIKFELPELCIKAAVDLTKNVPLVSLAGVQDIIDDGIKSLESANERRAFLYNETVNSILEPCVNKNLHWRHHLMGVYFLKHIVHPDMKYSPQVVKFFMKALIDDSIEIRKAALKVFLFVLLQNKPKYKKIQIDPFSLSNSKKDDVKPGIRTDNLWLLYNKDTVPRDETEWNKLRYLHRSEYGFYGWPKVLNTYAPHSEQPTISKRLHSLTDQEKVVIDFFNTENVAKLIEYLSMEEKKGKDHFRGDLYLIFKNFFKIFEDHFLYLFIPHLERLVKDTQEQSHRCAAEIISGLIKGTKHWSFKQSEDLWQKLIPILRTAFANLSVETMGDWSICIAMGIDKRDLSRYHWLTEFLMDDPLGAQSSFISCGRICFVQSALIPQTWRNAELNHRLLEYLKPHLAHPFQNVREKVGNCLTLIFADDLGYSNEVVISYPRVQDFFAFVMPKLNAFYESSLDTMRKIEEKQSINQLHSINFNIDQDKEEAIRLFKTVVKYVTGSLTRTNYAIVPDHYSLLPLACVLQSNDVDDELTTLCTNILAVMAHSMVLDKYIPAAVSAIRKVSSCPFWSARAVIAEIIPVFVFHNFATIVSNKKWIHEIQSIVLTLLEDLQPEVRQKAGKVVSGFLHCDFVPDSTALLEEFKLKSRTKLKERDMRNTQYNNHSMRVRHAGVLGMCAFVSCHPYDVPEYLPEIFLELGKHLNDPQPIPSTIRLALGDFKRTHHDNWDIHKLKFTEDELSLLSDLTVPPSYYA